MESNKNNRKIILGVAIIISFALLIFSISLYFNYQHNIRQSTRLDINNMKNMNLSELESYLQEKRDSEPIFHSFYLLPFIGFIGLLVGTGVYYIMSDKVIYKDKSLRKNTKIILNFLTNQERKVINILMENDGKVQQYELSHLPNMNKVKTHRIISTLEEKGVIKKEKLGKINKIVLNKELYDVLKD